MSRTATGDGDGGPGDGSPGDGSPGHEDTAPLLRVVRGSPDPAELAALVTVLVAAARGSGDAGGPLGARAASAAGTDPWRDHARRLGAPPTPGPGAWPTSARP